MRNRKFQKNSKKIQKIRRIPFWLHLKQKLVENCPEREKIAIIVPFRSYPVRNRKFQTNWKENSENLKILLWLNFQP